MKEALTVDIDDAVMMWCVWLSVFSDLLEECPFLRLTLPWGPLSSLQLSHRSESDDGPILWVRPGEQLIPTAEIGQTPMKKKM